MTEYQNLIITIDAAAANLKRCRFVTGAGAYPAAKALALGVVHEDVDTGDRLPAAVNGVVLVESGAAVTLTNGMAKIETDATGRAVPFTDGVVLGIAIDAATAAGQFIRVKLA